MADSKFTDAKGREWLIDLDIPTVDRVFKATGFNLFKILTPDEAAKIDGNPSLFLSVLFSIAEAQAKERGVNADDFKASFGKTMDIAEQAGEALMEAARNFSPSRHQPQLRELDQKTKAFQAAALKEANKLLAEMDPQKMAADQFKLLREQIGKLTPLSVPAPPGSTPAKPDLPSAG